MSVQQVQLSRSPWIDVCRLIAMFGVVVIHIASPMFNQYHSISIDAFLTANAFNSLARVSVPLFTMLSGALLLGRDTSFSQAGSRILRVAIPLVFWSFIYVFWIDSWSEKPFDPLEAISAMLQAPVMYHLWFVYMIIGIYMLLPVLRVITNLLISDAKFAIYFFVIWFVVNSITIYFPIKLIQQLNLSNFLSWPGYFILGYYLTNSEWAVAISKRLNGLVFLLASLITFFLNWHLNSLSLTPIIIANDYFSPNVVIASCAAFLWFRQVKIPNVLEKYFSFMSSMTFPIYFMHIFILSVLTGKNHGLSISPYTIHPVVGILELAIVTFFISMLITMFTRFIPNSSKILG